MRRSTHTSSWIATTAARRGRGGHSLLEALVVLAITSIMMGLVGGTLHKVRCSALSFECKNKLKTVGFEFFQFADDFSSTYRRAADQTGTKDFSIDSFQERLYRIGEFWKSGRTTQRYLRSRELLMCPAGPSRLERHAGLPCEAYAVTPAENVTVGFNMRLRQSSAIVRNRPVFKEVRLSSRILQHPSVPLAFDVDGVVAADRGILPYYAAPPAGDTGLYATGVFWFPSWRHAAINAVFVGGHVLSSDRPEQAAGWDWRYQPQPE